jgi:ATP-binding cassette subfamily B multidrug efflux pump
VIRLFRRLMPGRAGVAAILVFVFLQSLSSLYLPTLMADIVDHGVRNDDVGYILRVGGLMLLVACGGTVCSITASFLAARTSAAFGKAIRQAVFSRVQHFSLREFDTFGTATLITRTTNDVTQVQTVTVFILRLMTMAPMMAIGGLIMAILVDRPLSLVLAVAVPVLAIAIALIARSVVPLFRLMQTKLDTLNRVLRESLTGIRVVRAFNRTAYESRRFEAANFDLMDNAIQANRLMALLMPVLQLVMSLTIVAIVWFGAVRIDAGGMQVGSLIAFIQYAMQIMFSMVVVSMLFVMVPRAAASAARINAVLDTVPEITDPPAPRQPDATRGYLAFEHVTFRYPGDEQPALSDVSFALQPGEMTAIIGGTGSGKSTLVHLIMRFYDVDSGRILVDGIDVREMTQRALRAKIGFVPQKAVLFSGTISSNIRYGKATAQASEFVDSMADGLDARIAQGGANLSGGQKQRLAIARALVRRPEIYIFDDSFSALDFRTDARLRAALRRETADATVLVVAQRVATVMDADRIIVLDDGRVAGIGTHRQLMRECPVYREIVSSQLAEEEIA